MLNSVRLWSVSLSALGKIFNYDRKGFLRIKTTSGGSFDLI